MAVFPPLHISLFAPAAAVGEGSVVIIILSVSTHPFPSVRVRLKVTAPTIIGVAAGLAIVLLSNNTALSHR
jgi:hypothetical protein